MARALVLRAALGGCVCVRVAAGSRPGRETGLPSHLRSVNGLSKGNICCEGSPKMDTAQGKDDRYRLAHRPTSVQTIVVYVVLVYVVLVIPAPGFPRPPHEGSKSTRTS